MHEDSALYVIAAVVAGVLVTLGVTAASSRWRFSAPIGLVVVGAAISFLPGLPRVTVQPDWILFGLLPPLLYSAAIRTSIVDARARRDPIILLSVALVAYTVIVVGLTTWLVIPAISIAAAFAFGAVVAPTDAVAVTAVTRNSPLPRSVATVLDGESLLNDATALAALNGAIAAITATVTPQQIGASFLLAVLGGVGIGVAVGWVLSLIRSRVNAPVMDTSLALLAPYIAFLPAQAIGSSGILAVVLAGLVQSYRSPLLQSAEARIAETLNWRTISFLLENAVFLLIGLSLASIVSAAGATDLSIPLMIGICAAVLGVLLASRLIWGLTLTAIFRHGPKGLRRSSWQWHQTIAIAFAGIRGVVTLASVFLLPPSTPQRAFLQLLAFIVVMGTLVQSLLMPRLLRLLPSLTPPDHAQERLQTRMLLAEARNHNRSAAFDSGGEQQSAGEVNDPSGLLAGQSDAANMAVIEARRTNLRGQRRSVLAARAEHRYEEPVIRAVLRILDAEDIALQTMADAGTEER